MPLRGLGVDVEVGGEVLKRRGSDECKYNGGHLSSIIIIPILPISISKYGNLLLQINLALIGSTLTRDSDSAATLINQPCPIKFTE